MDQKQGNTLGEIHTKVFFRQDSHLHHIEMHDFNSVIQIMDLRSSINPDIATLDQILNNGMLLDVFVHVSFKSPVMSLTIVGKAVQRSFCLASGIVDIIGPKEVSDECIPRFASIMSLRVWLQISPTCMVMSSKCKLVKGFAIVDLKCRIIHYHSIHSHSSNRHALHHLIFDGNISSWGILSHRKLNGRTNDIGQREMMFSRNKVQVLLHCFNCLGPIMIINLGQLSRGFVVGLIISQNPGALELGVHMHGIPCSNLQVGFSKS